MNLSTRISRRVTVTAVAVISLTLPATSALAATVPVDPGPALSAGKAITGTGQNLPSLNVTANWVIGPNPAAQVNAYYASGITTDRTEVARAALRWTRSWVKSTCGSIKPAKVRACKAAAVFDIDETLLSNYDWISTLPQPFTFGDGTASTAATQNCTTPVIQPTVDLFNSLKRLGVTPFLVTGRSESDRAVTLACLAKSGITGFEALILKPAGNTQNAGQRKADQRHELIKQGWKIGPSVGDQISDMSLGSLEHGFLLPNPIYFLP